MSSKVSSAPDSSKKQVTVPLKVNLNHSATAPMPLRWSGALTFVAGTASCEPKPSCRVEGLPKRCELHAWHTRHTRTMSSIYYKRQTSLHPALLCVLLVNVYVT
jgi:hypothetical protein